MGFGLVTRKMIEPDLLLFSIDDVSSKLCNKVKSENVNFVCNS